MGPLVIFGAGDIARLAHFYFRTDSGFDVVAFAVDQEYKTGDTFDGLPLVASGDLARTYPPGSCAMFVALSYRRMNRIRAEKYQQMKDAGYTLATYVSSRCTYLSERPPGDNCLILEDNTIQPFVTIGSDVTLWSGNHIGHDSTIDDHCFIASHVVVSGHVRVRSFCFIGVNATLRNGIEIAAGSLIGAGAVIMKDTREKGVYLAGRAELFPKNSDQVEP
jgi:sugar O-acyltransferase (sialic acid O-acetyltransferase NeuD family)